MKKGALRIAGVLLALVVLLLIILGPAAPLLVRLGAKPICIQGEFPELRVVSCPPETTSQTGPTPMPLPVPQGGAPIPVIFDDDGSPDGMIALLYFLAHPYYEVRAVTVSPGEAHPRLFAQHLAQLLAALGQGDIPVGYGRETPLVGENAFPEPWRQASDNFWELPLPEPAQAPVEPVPAIDLIIDTLSKTTQPALVFVSGTHTNLAEVMRQKPDSMNSVQVIAMMGGSIHVPGNISSDWPEIDNRVAEWNIWVDPLAAREVFSSGVLLQVTPLDATNQIMWSKADGRMWADSSLPAGKFAGEILTRLLDSWSAERMYVWDLVAAVVATDPSLCQSESLALDVETASGPEQGRIIRRDEPANATVCLNPDVEQIKLRVTTVLAQSVTIR